MTAFHQSWHNAGVEQLNLVVEKKSSLATALHRFNVTEPSTEILFMAFGFAHAAANTLARLHAAGMRFTGAGAFLNDSAPFVLEHVTREFNGGPERRRKILLTLGNALAKCIERGYVRPAAPRVKREAVPAQEPEKTLKVEIVGLPNRTTTTAITRDESGAIIASSQLERDAA